MLAIVGSHDLARIEFPRLSAASLELHLVRWLQAADPPLVHDAIRPFARFVVTTLKHVSHDLGELRHFAQLLLPPFADALHRSSSSAAAVSSSPTSSSPGAIRLRIDAAVSSLNPHARRALAYVFRHDATSDEVSSPATQPHVIELSKVLPVSARFVLVASFLASYNPPGLDKALFSAVTSHNRRARRARVSRQPASSATVGPNDTPAPPRVEGTTPAQQRKDASSILLGPRPFALDRMVAILQTLQQPEERASLALLHSHIASLVSLNLLSHVSAEWRQDVLDEVRLVCNITLSVALAMSKSLGVRLHDFLYDPHA
jgi:hypothetical protein